VDILLAMYRVVAASSSSAIDFPCAIRSATAEYRCGSAFEAVCFNPGSAGVSWKRRFDDAIVPPDGHKLVTLLHAATYATKLPKNEAYTAEWQPAIESLMLVAEFGGPAMFARIGVMRALNRHAEGVFDPSRKETHYLPLHSATSKYDADFLVADPIKDRRRPS
jgi:hypothetical protein